MTADPAVARAAEAAAEARPSRLTDDEDRLVACAAGSWHRLDPKPST
jgi:hypothetical protein